MSHGLHPARRLRQRLADNQLTLGMLITNHLWLELIEIAVDAGMDYVIIDLEHVQHGDPLVADACRLGRMTGFPVLIRPPRTDPESIRLALDLGPCGLMLPMIESAAHLDAVRDGLWMPPRGQRRPGGHGNWWVSDFHYRTWRESVEDDIFVMPQVESPKGLKNAAAIAGHEITAALAVGPYDLSARLGVCWQPDSEELQGALSSLRAAADGADKPMWMIGDGATLTAAGFRFICIAEPANLLRATIKGMVDNLRHDRDDPSPEAFVP